ncbi:winged helix-turn-helix transcriptional regulator [Tessaracoccus flavescens]|uniref:winged helix-turn-helix transcriptional regulator n=1 Tax=Tessaracoccus flavescens TaxID=399497 RepID=UPI003AAA819D
MTSAAATTCTQPCARAATCSTCPRTSGAPWPSAHWKPGRNATGSSNDAWTGSAPRCYPQTLIRLEAHGLITRSVYPEFPARVEYETHRSRAERRRTVETAA